MKKTLFLLSIIFNLSCQPLEPNLKQENAKLKMKIDSLKNELHKADMLIQSYEGIPLNFQ